MVLIEWVIEQLDVINETLFKKISRDMMKLNLLFVRKIYFDIYSIYIR